MRLRLSLGVLVLVASIAVSEPVSAAAKNSVSVKATPTLIGASGGRVSLRVTVRSTALEYCAFKSSPKVGRFAGIVNCTNRTITRSGTLGKNLGPARTIYLYVGVSTSGKHEYQAAIHQAAAPTPSATLSSQDANYVGAESRLLTAFSIGVANGDISDGSRVAVSGSENGISASDQVWYGKNLQTAAGFNLNYGSAYTNQSGTQQVIGSGNLFVASSDSTPVSTTPLVVSHSARLTLARQSERMGSVTAHTINCTELSVGSDTGGLLTFCGSVIYYENANGNIATASVGGSDAVQSNVDKVLGSNVPRPGTLQVEQSCLGTVTSVSNTYGFVLSVDTASSSGSQSIVSVRATKSTRVNCQTGQATTSSLVDVVGSDNGSDFQAITDSPGVTDVVAPDNGAAPLTPPLTNYTVSPSYVQLLPPVIPPSGTPPSPVTFDGIYSGPATGSQTLTDGSTQGFSGTISFTVSANAITVSDFGSGTGTIDASGNATFSSVVTPMNGGTGGTCQYSGTFTPSNGGYVASGTMDCVGPGTSVTATWTASDS